MIKTASIKIMPSFTASSYEVKLDYGKATITLLNNGETINE